MTPKPHPDLRSSSERRPTIEENPSNDYLACFLCGLFFGILVGVVVTVNVMARA